MHRAAALSIVVLLAGCAGTPSPGDEEGPRATSPAIPPAEETMPPSAPSRPTTPLPSTPAGPTATSPGEPGSARSFLGCEGEGPVAFDQAPMRMEDVGAVLPYGLVVGAHVTPIDHMYFSPADQRSPRDAYEVRMIADGVIYSIQPRDINVDTGASKAREWRLDIAHTCTFTSYFDLLTSVTPEIEAAYHARRAGPWNGLPLASGQLVGRIGGQTLDFGVYDYNVTLPGFVRPESYAYEPWKVHTVDPFPYFPADVRDAMLAKALRTVEPRAGRIDHDVDGTVQGNWFKVGTRGYQGLVPSYYWEGHLSISPDAYDPSAAIFSIGNFSGQARQFALRSDPDPSAVTPASGLQRWELVHYEHIDTQTGARGFGPQGIQPGHSIRLEAYDDVQGTVLLEMTGPRALRLEVFPGATAAQVAGFTDAASSYER